MITEFILLILGAYLLGSAPTAYLVAKWHRGIDIRQYGSGNVGIANLMKLTSKRITIPVIIFDIAKGLIMVCVAKLIGLDVIPQVAIGLAAVIGHNWPIFLRFNGGRGLLTTLGVIFILPLTNNLVPWEIIAFLTIMLISWFLFHNVPVGMLIAITILPLISWGDGKPLPITLGFLAMLLMMTFRRLTAPRNSFTASVTPRQLFVNRLLFDRDIRDREAWINRETSE
ncbi:glycerol-3-phosphate acyltransferase [Chloroflexota bacterium]